MTTSEHQRSRQTSILELWKAIELFSPQRVPQLRDSRRFEPVTEWAPGQAAPWEEGQALRRRAPGRKTAWRHYVYFGAFDLDHVHQELEKHFGSDPDAAESQSWGQACLGAVAVTDTGRPLLDTYTVSSLSWALGRTRRPGPGNPSWLEGFEPFQQGAQEGFASRMSLPPDDDRGNELRGKGFALGPEVDGAFLGVELEELFELCGWPPERSFLRHAVIIRSLPVSRMRKYSVDDFDFLNSFFLADLRRVQSAMERGDHGRAVEVYLSAVGPRERERHLDVRQTAVPLIEGLQPNRFPAGCWPNRRGHPLVLSQQFAVNTALADLADKSGLFAVNGPPGTGKTTLLRDLIAAVIVRRADVLATLSSPAEAFGERAGWWQAGQYRRSIRSLQPHLRGHEIVVASSNNGAVENVTLEIPGWDAVSEEIATQASYFADVGSAVIEGDAWALLAAPLGNKQNRSRFVSSFWFGKSQNGWNREGSEKNADGTESNLEGMLALLKAAEEQRPPSWAAAKKRYARARCAVERLTAERQKMAEVAADLPRLHTALTEALDRVSQMESELGEAEAHQSNRENLVRRLRAVVVSLEERLASHRRARPGILEIVLSWGRSWKEWQAENRELRSRLQNSRTELHTAESNLTTAEEELRNRRTALEKARDQAASLRERLAAAHELLDDFRARTGLEIPDLSFWSATERREVSSPWVDRTWNDARERLFVEALHLHRALVLREAQTFRRNLQGAVDLLGGQAPSGAPLAALRSAFETLFLVVPVISTTFASFDRLFAAMGSEALGWLFIDEAGQAVPQAAVGALWRSRRAVVVGDPQQLEPIVSLPPRAIETLRQHFGTAPEWRPDSTSTQELADRHTPVGTDLKTEEATIWVGSPLRVHRRCDEPMFSIANRIAYGEMMVNGTEEREPLPGWPLSVWLDVRATSSEGNWIEQEGRVALELLRRLPDPGRAVCITPFRHVVKGFQDLLRAEFPEFEVGTVHTYQGKEADAVLLILGGSLYREGALDWVAARPNLLNVAVTRARRRLYVVGNRSRWRTRPFFSELARHLPSREVEETAKLDVP